MTELRDTLSKALTMLEIVDADLPEDFIVALYNDSTRLKRHMIRLKQELVRHKRRIKRQKLAMERSSSR
jgi:precorrin-3B methylase